MAMGICRQGSLSGGEMGREIPSAVRGTVQLPLVYIKLKLNSPPLALLVYSFVIKGTKFHSLFT
ncbi:hypothetical protein Hanom_Chr11g01002151 [Helianthus anomalus]